MRYLILGTGGTGGCIGGYLASSGKNVTFVARGQHLKAMKENGLLIHSSLKGRIKLDCVQAYSSDEICGKFDVIFVCVKGYSLLEIIPLLEEVSHEKTIVIPILNSLRAGDKLRKALPGVSILDGCIYVSAYISAPGEILQGIKIFRVVFGSQKEIQVDKYLLLKIQKDLIESGIEGILSNNIQRDIFKKFAFTSACAATGAYYDVVAGEIQKQGLYHDTFVALLKELVEIAKVLNIELDSDLIEESLNILAGLAIDTTASLQKDLKQGKDNEVNELIFDVVRIAEEYNIDIPHYYKIAGFFGYSKV